MNQLYIMVESGNLSGTANYNFLTFVTIYGFFDALGAFYVGPSGFTCTMF